MLLYDGSQESRSASEPGIVQVPHSRRLQQGVPSRGDVFLRAVAVVSLPCRVQMVFRYGPGRGREGGQRGGEEEGRTHLLSASVVDR